MAFQEQGYQEKVETIKTFFDQEIRPLLRFDGGDLSIEEIREEEEKMVVTISYRGACIGCASAESGTLAFMRNLVIQRLDPSITLVLR